MRPAILLATSLIAGMGWAADERPIPKPLPSQPLDHGFLPLGVYWPGEQVPRKDDRKKIDLEKTAIVLDDLAKHHVTAIWLTHCDPWQSGQIARIAGKRGIRIVAAIQNIDGSIPHVRKGSGPYRHDFIISEALKWWGDAPRPIAWCLADEPRTPYMNEMSSYVESWRRLAPGEPVTTVVMHRDLDAATAAGFDALCTNIYPFFSNGNPNRYMGSDWEAWTSNVRRVCAATKHPWMMGQSYQEPWGPYEIDRKGNIIYLPGSAPHWVMPTADQTRWMALTAFAEGAKGMFYFVYKWPVGPNPDAKPANLPAKVRTRTDSRSPKGMVYPDGSPTPQYEAMAEAYGWIRGHAAILSPAKPVDVNPAEDRARKGHLVRLLENPDTGERHVMVVTHFGAKGSDKVSFPLADGVTGLTQVLAKGERAANLRIDAADRTASVTLPPSRAALFRCVKAKP